MLISVLDCFSIFMTVVLCVVLTVLSVVRRHTDVDFLRESYIRRSSIQSVLLSRQRGVFIGWIILGVTLAVNEDYP